MRPLPASRRHVEVGRVDGGRAETLGYGRGWLLRNLPIVLQEDELLARVVTLFEDIATSVRHAVVSADGAADLATAPPGMVRYLGAWVSAPVLDHTDDERQRRAIVAAAGATLAARGTAGALRHLVGAVTGGTVEVRESGGVFGADGAPHGPGCVQVRVDHAGALRPHELVELVRAELPAHVTAVIVIGEEQVWPTTPTAVPATVTP
jgi:phage tail-like protein